MSFSYDFDKLCNKLFSLGSVRAAPSGRMVITYRDFGDKRYAFVLSKREPAATALPFNVLWMPFDTGLSNYKKLYRRIGKEPLPINPFGHRNTWIEVLSVQSILDEIEYYDIYDSTLRGDYVPQNPFIIYPSSTTVSGKVLLNIDNTAAHYPVVVGDNDIRMTNSRAPVAHDHPEFENRPGLAIATSNGNFSLETLNAPEAGDVLVCRQDNQAIWRKPVVDDIAGYISPPKLLRIIGQQSYNYQVNEHGAVTLGAETEAYDGTVSIVTENTVFTTTGLDNIAVVGNTITFGEVTSSVSVLITATYSDPITSNVLSSTTNIAVINVPGPETLFIHSVDEFDELSSTEFTATARYTDGTVKAVTDVVWMVDNLAYAEFAGNVLTANDVYAGGDKRVPVVITASFTDTTTPIPVTVVASKTVKIIDKDYVLPVSIMLIGPSVVTEGSTVTYTPRVTYNNGMTEDLPVTGLNPAVWTTSSDLVNFPDDQVNKVEFGRVLHTVQDVEVAVAYTYEHPGTGVENTLHNVKLVTVSENNVVVSTRIVGATTIDEKTSHIYEVFVEYDDGFAEDISDSCAWSIELPDGTLVTNTINISFNVNTKQLTVGEMFGNIPELKLHADYTVSGVMHRATIAIVVNDVTPYPETIIISGPTQLTEQSSDNFSASVVYTDGTTKIKTVTWVSSDPTLAVFDGSMLTVADITEDKTVTITATYTELFDGNLVTVTENAVISLVYQPPVVISVELQTVDSSSVVDENSTMQLKVVRNWSDGHNDVMTDLTGVIILPSVSNEVEIAIDADGMMTIGNVAENTNAVINLAWTDDYTDITHTDELPLTVAFVSAIITGLKFNEVGEEALLLTEHMTMALSVTAMYENNTTVSIPASSITSWTVSTGHESLVALDSSTNVLSVLANAVDSSISPVDITITAEYLGQTAVAEIQLLTATPVSVSLSIDPDVTVVRELESINFSLIATLNNGLTVDVTTDASVIWSVSDPTIVTISSGIMNTLNITTDKVVTITANYFGLISTVEDVNIVAYPPVLMSVVFDQTAPVAMDEYGTQYLTLSGSYDDSVVRVIDPSAVSFTSSTPGLVTLDNTGHESLLVTANGILATNSPVPTTITATINGRTASIIINVAVSPLNLLSLNTGGAIDVLEQTTLNLGLVARYNSGVIKDVATSPEVIWTTVPDPADCTVVNGVVTAADVTADKMVTIKANYRGMEATFFDLVIKYKPPVVETLVMSVSNNDVFTSETVSVVSVAATFDVIPDANVSATAVYTVFPSTAGSFTGTVFTPDAVSITEVTVVTLTATHTGVSSSIDVTVRPVVMDSLVMTLSATSITESETIDITALTATYNNAVVTDAMLLATYTVSPATAGSVTGTVFTPNSADILANTDATIVAEYDGESTSVPITIGYVAIRTGSTLETPLISLFEGQAAKVTLKETFDNGSVVDASGLAGVVWSSSDSNVIEVTDGIGNILTKPVTADTVCTISAEHNGVTSTIDITVVDIVVTAIGIVNTSPINLYEGESLTLNVEATYNNGTTAIVPTTDISFSSSDVVVAPIDTDGMVVTTSVDSDTDVIISADYIPNSTLSDMVDVKVINIVPVDITLVTPPTVNENTTDNTGVQVTARFNNGATAIITPSVGVTLAANSGVVTITDDGTAFKFDASSVDTDTNVIFTATLGSLTATSTTTVVDIPHVISLAVMSPLTSPQNEIAEGGTVKLEASARYSNNAIVVVSSSPDIIWASTIEIAATVSSDGLVTTYNVTNPPVHLVISATFQGIVAEYPLTVLNMNG